MNGPQGLLRGGDMVGSVCAPQVFVTDTAKNFPPPAQALVFFIHEKFASFVKKKKIPFPSERHFRWEALHEDEMGEPVTSLFLHLPCSV